MPVRVDWLSRAAYSGMFFFGVVMAVLGAVLPLLTGSVKLDLGQTGNLFLAMNFAMLASGLVVGPFMDRFGKKPLLIAGPFLVAAALAVMAGATHYRPPLVRGVRVGAGGAAPHRRPDTVVAGVPSAPRPQ